MGRVLRGNVRKVITWFTVPDAYSTDLANTLAAYGPQSPASTGAQGLSNQGLPGVGVNAFEGDCGPVQRFAGVPLPVARPLNGFGELHAGSLPNTGSSNNSLAWLSMGQVGPGYGS
jgi:hypothetical protein